MDQFKNDANFEVHCNTTAREIILQLKSIGKQQNYIIAGIGTSGHIVAIAKRVKERYWKNTKIIGVQPAKGSAIPGIKRV